MRICFVATFQAAHRSVLWLGVFLFLPAVVVAAQKDQKTDPSRLTLDRIFAGGEFAAQGFSGRWLPEGGGYTTLQRSPDVADGRDIVRHDPASDKKEVLVTADQLTPAGRSAPLAVEGYQWSDSLAQLLIFTNSRRVWRLRTRGDYWLLDRTSGQLRKLGGDAAPSTLMFAKISPTGRYVAYVRDRNIYLEDLLDGSIKPLTRTASDNIINGTFDWVYEEEFHLRDGFRWSPDGRRIAYWQLDTTGVRRFPLVNNTDSLYPQVRWFAYPKVGQRNSACRIGVVDIDSGKTQWIKLPGDPREHYIARMDWAESNDEIILQQLNRLQNTNRVMLYNVRSGKLTTLLVERDKAWVDVHDELMWLEGGRRFTWISERDGWRHVYLLSRTGGKPALATPGQFDVIRLLHVDDADGWLYFVASPDNPTQRYLYRVRLDGTGLERLSPAEPGTHQYRISPDGRWAFHTFSTFDDPPRTELVRLPGHDVVRTLAANKSLRERVGKLARQPAEWFRVDIGGGIKLDGWCVKPPKLKRGRKYPLLIHVYGEPAGQTVLDRWGGRKYLWHLMLAQRGYVVMSFDNRGTPAPRGRAWRKCVYRKIGILAPQDQAAALRAVLGQRSYLDATRVGIWGASGGGSMSLNAIFKYPDLYHTAIAIAPVPNQRYYDTIYQERYMGLPQDNVEGFRQGSPINFAKQLKGNLLLIHGTGDDNCHYQTTELLINELVRHNKPFTMMAYPNRTHALHEGRNTTRHMYQLMTNYLLEHLPPGGRRVRKGRNG